MFTGETLEGEHSQTASQTFSEDSLETDPKNDRPCENVKCNRPENNESIILAGNLAKERYILPGNSCQIAKKSCDITCGNKQCSKDTSNMADETSYLSIKPDLNKRIDLFCNKHLRKEHDACEYSSISSTSEIKDKKNIDSRRSSENKLVEVQYELIHVYPRALSATSLKRDQTVFKKEIRKSKSCTALNDNSERDTNHNIKRIKDNQFSPVQDTKITITEVNNREEAETLVPMLLLSEYSVLSNKKDNSHSIAENQNYNSTNGESTKEELDAVELKTLLQSLEDQQKASEDETQEHLLRRFSVTFCNSPRNFTERLLTIIEESIVNDDSGVEFPEVSLCRLTEELRKMCKFIENETAPEWPSSPGMSTSTCAREGNQEPRSSPSRKSPDDAHSNLNESSHSVTPVASRLSVKNNKKIYRCVPKTISSILATKSPMYDSTAPHDSTRAFECLEAYCKKLYPDERRTPLRQECRLPARNMNSILRTCDDQMASLENSPNIHEQECKNARTQECKNVATFTCDSSDSDSISGAQNLYRLLAREEYDDTEPTLSTSSATSERSPAGRRENRDMIEPDDLEDTLMYEIAKKRQRCLDTAKVMMEIDATPESAVARSARSSIESTSETSSSTSNDNKLMETLMSCKRYQDYLREYKPLLNLLRRAESYGLRSPRDKKDVRDARTNKADVATPGAPKFSATRTRSPGPSSRHRSTSNRAFAVSKPRLFVTPGKTPVSRTVCKEKRTYFLDAPTPSKQKESSNTSPHAKNAVYRQIGLNYGSVISPVGMYIKGTDPRLVKNLRPKTDEMLLTPRKRQTTPCAIQKPEMKFKLSPKQPKEVSERILTTAQTICNVVLQQKRVYCVIFVVSDIR